MSDIFEELVAIPAPPLANRKQPYYERQQEQPWHRVAIELTAQGYTPEEVAHRLQKHVVTVRDVLKQPMLQQTIVDTIHKVANKDQEVVELIRENVVEAVNALAEIVVDKSAKNSDRITAANSLLDRRYGKPNQPMSISNNIDLDTLSDAELAKLIPHTTGTANSSAQ